MKKLIVLVTGLMLGIAAQAHCATAKITYKQPPMTEEEKAIAQVYQMVVENRVSNARAASELFTRDAVVSWIEGVGTAAQERTLEGREKIYMSFSSGRVQAVGYRDVTIKVVDGDRAEVAFQGFVEFVGGQGIHFVRQSDVAAKLRREPEGWRIFESRSTNSILHGFMRTLIEFFP